MFFTAVRERDNSVWDGEFWTRSGNKRRFVSEAGLIRSLAENGEEFWPDSIKITMDK